MKNKQQTTITLTPEEKEQAKEISREILGQTNISGLFSYWINNHKKKGEKV